ncbi:MAG: hypothetical protein IJE84_04810, partial [Clostridia bacterium]|nr:hypothetical protein [Clostridia bacterium]
IKVWRERFGENLLQKVLSKPLSPNLYNIFYDLRGTLSMPKARGEAARCDKRFSPSLKDDTCI